MILVDTSIWVDLFSRRPRHTFSATRRLELVTCGPVIQEVVQGIRPESRGRIAAGMLALPCLGEPIGREVFIEAAELYQHARDRGITVRSATDCLIAAIAIRHGATVWHDDRDYDALAKVSALRVLRSRSLT